jgi:hypothetical protein
MIYFRETGTKLWHWSKLCPNRPLLRLEYTGFAGASEQCLDCKEADDAARVDSQSVTNKQ